MATFLFLALGGGCTSASGPAQPGADALLPAPPSSFDAELGPAAVALAEGPQTCQRGDLTFSFDANETFIAVSPGEEAFSGEWKAADGDLVFQAEGSLPADRCSFARWMSAPGGHVLVCAEGPFGCGLRADWVVEVVDVGAEPGAVEKVAGVLTEISEAYGTGVVVRGGGGSVRGEGVTIQYRVPPEGGAATRQLARHIADLVGTRLQTDRLKVVQDRAASASVVVQVSGLVHARR